MKKVPILRGVERLANENDKRLSGIEDFLQSFTDWLRHLITCQLGSACHTLLYCQRREVVALGNQNAISTQLQLTKATKCYKKKKERKKQLLTLREGCLLQHNYEIMCHLAIPIQVAQRHQGHILGNDESKLFLVKSQMSQIPCTFRIHRRQLSGFLTSTLQLISCVSLCKYLNLYICASVFSVRIITIYLGF